MSIYDSVPLPRPDKQIRLLHRQASHIDSTDDSWRLQLHEFGDNCPSYIAISYVWGDTDDLLREVIVNEQRVQVRLTCWYALWQMSLRFETSTTPLWIDSICVNQRDDVEKSTQVAMMGPIYERALFVASCIGQGDDLRQFRKQYAQSQDLEYLSYSTSLYHQLELGAGHLNDPIPFGTSETPHSQPQRSLKPMRIPGDSEWSLNDMNCRPYFTRMWIVQEVILARGVYLFCGTDSISWEELERVMDRQPPVYHAIQGLIEWRRRLRRISVDEIGQQSQVPQEDSNHDSRDFAEIPNMCDLLLTFSQANCSDPRDKVYALLSLLPDSDIVRQKLKVNYAQSLFSLIADIAPLLLESAMLSGRNSAVIAIRLLVRLFSIGVNSIEEALDFLQQRAEPITLPPNMDSLDTKDFLYMEGGVQVIVLSDKVNFEQVEQACRAALSTEDPRENGMRYLGVITDTITASEAKDWPHNPKSHSRPSPHGVESLKVSDFKMIRVFYPSDGDGVWRLYRTDYITRSDIQHGDIVIRPSWLKSNSYWSGPPSAVFRRSGNSAFFYLHSWCRLSGATSSDFGVSKERPSNNIRSAPQIHFHHTDVLAWALIEDWPSETLQYCPIRPGASHILLPQSEMEVYNGSIQMCPAQLQ